MGANMIFIQSHSNLSKVQQRITNASKISRVRHLYTLDEDTSVLRLSRLAPPPDSLVVLGEADTLRLRGRCSAAESAMVSDSLRVTLRPS